MKTKRICNKLNKLIFEKKEGFIDEVNKIIYDLYQKGGEMYWHRNVFLDNNGNDNRMRDLVRKSDKVMFVPSDDEEEHPGVTIIYKPEYDKEY